MIRRSRGLLAALFLATVGAATLAAPALAAPAAPAWRIVPIASPTNFAPGMSDGSNMYIVKLINVGGAATDGSPVTVTADLPPGFVPQPTPGNVFIHFQIFADNPSLITPCSAGPPVTCTLDHTLIPGESITVLIPLQTPASGPETVSTEITVSGGGIAPVSTSVETPFNADTPPFGIQRLDASLTAADGNPVTQAGDHPFSFRFNYGGTTARNAFGLVKPPEGMRNTVVKLPPGLVVNSNAAPKCTEAQLETPLPGFPTSCPTASNVATINYQIALFGFVSSGLQDPVYNMVTPPGSPAAFGFNVASLSFYTHILGNVDSTRNYAPLARVSDIPEYGELSGAALDFWGDPSDPAHDLVRGDCENNGAYLNDTCPVPPNPAPFVTMPTACSGPLGFTFTATSWQNQNPGTPVTASAEAGDADGNGTDVTGCGALDFQPSLEARPTTNVADSPSGLDVDLHIPQNNSHDTLATAHLKDAVVALPEGITINPGGGNGLAACSSSQIGLVSPVGQEPIRFDGDHADCPDAAKQGTVEVTTPLLSDPLPGSVYLAAPYDNPFASFLAIYIVVDDPQTGVIVKLAGKVEADPETGQLTTTFKEGPQLPFEDFELHFFGGASGTLRTPELCGDYSTTSELTPWSAPDSGPPATPQDDYVISQGPGGSCPKTAAEVPNSPSFDAGSVSPLAGVHSPFVLHLRRDDATQQFSGVTVNPPPGLTAKLAGTAICPESAIAAAAQKSGQEEKANPSCPASSDLGTTVAGVGAGPAPYYAKGKSYLAGPYKGAPLSFAVITPATAGPFDLGTVVVRAAVYIDPKTAKITAIADPLPRILEGIPLDVRTIDQFIDKPNFTLNGTSCEPSSVGGTLTTTLGQITPLFSRYQLGDCSALGFKPKLTLRLKGGTTRGKHPALTATLQARGGDANIAAASVALPRSEFLDQAHIGTVCTRVQFAADECPAASIYGTATVTTPLVDYPLTGNAYLRSSDNKLPDLVLDLRGPAFQPVRLEAAGRTDSIKGGIRNSFDFVPDAPFTKFTLQLFGGRKGLLQNSTNICKELNRATAKYTAHNGDVYEARPVLKAKCGKQGRKDAKGKRGKRRARG